MIAMFIVSFYSFKGGVGRTVALLNSAWHLASRGSRVALLDLDLEAPGLQSARLRRDPRHSRTGWSPPVPQKGLCDLVVQFAASNAIEDWPDGYLTEGLGPDGRMALIAARGEGQGLSIGDYEGFVQTFSWARFYLEMNGRGFMEGLVKALADRGYDYLFIDARTGLTDVAGITLLHLPDLVVLITNLSDQSVQGIKTQLEAVHAVNKECTGGGSLRRRHGRENTPISILLTGSTLPRGELKSRQERLRAVESTLGEPLDILIDYLPLLALEEENHILAQTLESRRDEMLLGSNRPYERLVEEIVARNPAAPENLLVVGEELNQIGRWREALAHFDEAQDRYGDYQQGILWEARLHKMKAQVQALDARAAEQSLDWLEQHQQGRERNRLEETAQIVRGRLALSRVYVTLNQFEQGRDQAQRALGTLQEAKRSRRGQGHELRSLRAACRFSLGQAHGLCGAWEEACAALQVAADNYKALGTRPLLECLAVAELARALLLTGQPLIAQQTLEWARIRAGLADPHSSTPEVRRPRSSGGVASTYVQGRLLQAEAEILCEQGQGRSAIKALLKAFNHFHRDGDGVGLVEVAASLAAFDLSLPKLDDKASEEPWALWKEAANRLGMQRIAVRLDLLKSMRSLARSPAAQTFRKRMVPGQIVDESLQWLLLLERSRQLLSSGQPLPEIRDLLAKIRRVSNKSKRQREIEHELSLLDALVEIAKDDKPKPLETLVAYAESLRLRNLRTREVQARFVIALGDPGSDQARDAFRASLAHIEEPVQWLWNLPIAFVRHSEYFKSRWASLDIVQDNAWPLPLKSESSSPSRRGRSRSRSRAIGVRS